MGPLETRSEAAAWLLGLVGGQGEERVGDGTRWGERRQGGSAVSVVVADRFILSQVVPVILASGVHNLV